MKLMNEPTVTPVPDGEEWGCLVCSLEGESADAVVLEADEESTVGLCELHAEEEEENQ